MKNIINICLICCLFHIQSIAQQIPSFQIPNAHGSFVNPALKNIENTIFENNNLNSLGISMRKQWTKIQDAPTTGLLHFDRNFDEKNMLAGINVILDETGPTSLMGAYFRYAYQLQMNNSSTLSIGVAAGFYQFKYNGSESLLRDANDIIGLEIRNKIISDFKLGIYYQAVLSNRDIIYAGISVPQLASANIDAEGKEDFYVYRAQHFFANVGYIKFLDNANEFTYLESSVSAKYTKNSPFQLGAIVRFQFNGICSVGIGYDHSIGYGLSASNQLHLEGSVILGDYLGFDKQLFKITYGFDRTMGRYNIQLDNSHELGLIYSF